MLQDNYHIGDFSIVLQKALKIKEYLDCGLDFLLSTPEWHLMLWSLYSSKISFTIYSLEKNKLI